MKCPKCGERYVEVHGVFSGTQKIQFHPDDDDGDFTVVDSEPTDFEWDDDTTVVCLECGHEGTAADFEQEAWEEEQAEPVRPADSPPQSTTGEVETPIQRATRWLEPEA